MREVYIRAEGLERDSTLFQFLLAAHLCPAETSRERDTHALYLSCGDNFLHRLLQHSAKWHPLLQTFCNHVCNDGRIGLRLSYFNDIKFKNATVCWSNFAHQVGKFFAQFYRVLARTADDEAGATCGYDNAQFARRALYLYSACICTAQFLHKETANELVNFDILAVALLVGSEPTALPVSDDAEAVRIGM